MTNDLRGVYMKISYKPLFRLLLERDMSKMDLLKAAEISTTTLSKLGKNESIKLETIMKICVALNCRIEDVVDFT